MKKKRRIFRKVYYRQDVPMQEREHSVMDKIQGSFVEKAVVYIPNEYRCCGIRFDGKAFFAIASTKTKAYSEMRRYATMKNPPSILENR